MNYKYAKILSDSEVQYAPKIIKIKNKTYINPKESVYNQAGYYKLVLSNYPEDDKEYIPQYSIYENTIVQSWVEL